MDLPSLPQCHATIDATWPPQQRLSLGPWTIRLDPSGSSRVSAATATADLRPGDIAAAVAAMQAAGQQPLFMIRDQDSALDRELAALGCQVKDPVNIYAGPVAQLAQNRPPPVSVFEVWPPLAAQVEIWATGGIGAGRRAIMDRAPFPKTSFLGRAKDRPAGSVFVGLHSDCAMIHALEIAAPFRRQGLARHLVVAAAFWAQAHRAHWLTLVATRANAPAHAVYASVGLVVVGHYHYRIWPEAT